MCTEETGKKHCFEMITKHRVFQLAAKNHQEMVDWMKMLSAQGILYNENECIKQAEEMIAKASYDKYIQQTGSTVQMLSLDLHEIIEKERRQQEQLFQFQKQNEIDTEETADVDF